MHTIRHGFSLVGTLILGASLAAVGALLFPALVTAGERCPRASCQSNLREIGAAVMMYMEDYHGTAPLARSVEIDAEPLAREGRQRESPFIVTGGKALLSPALGHCPPLGRPGLWPLHLVLDSYISRPTVWQDPEDIGDQTISSARNGSATARTAFAKYGASYQYHQGLVWRVMPHSTAPGSASAGVGRLAPVQREEIGHPSEVPLVFDGEGYWHGSASTGAAPDPEPYLAAAAAKGYNVVLADGRACFVSAPRLLNRSQGRPIGLLYRDPRKLNPYSSDGG